MKMVMNKAEYDEYVKSELNMPQPGDNGFYAGVYVEPESYPCIVGYSVTSWMHEQTKAEIFYMSEAYERLMDWWVKSQEAQ